jgi:hypothetical protein
MFSYIVLRSRETLPGESPNRFAALVTADVGSALAQDADLDVHHYVQERYGTVLSRVYVVMKEGRVRAAAGWRLISWTVPQPPLWN